MTKKAKKEPTPDKKSPRKQEAPQGDLPKELRFHYLKSNFFRVVHVEGIQGGISPHGQIQMAVFNERRSIPQQTVYELAADGTLGDEIIDERIEREGVIREVEFELFMSVETATGVAEWLKDKIEQIKSIEAQHAPNKEANT